MKNWQTRWDETINYLKTNFAAAELGEHIESLVPEAMRKDISKELSVGKNPGKDGEDDPAVKSTQEQRAALRSLLLCQRVYYSKLWAKKTFSPGNIVEDEWSLVKGWKDTSLKHWGGKSEKDILQGIGMFVIDPKATLADLVAVAKKGKPDGIGVLPGNLTLSRADKVTRGAAETCYNGIIGWLLQSGIVSMRWVMQDTSPNGVVSCNRLFGTGTPVWKGKKPFVVGTSALPVVGTGHILHMWIDESGVAGWNGHWVISNGNGSVCGVNNGEIRANEEDDGVSCGPEVKKAYTNNGTLMGQWLGYGGKLWMNDKKGTPFRDATKYAHANLFEFNPLEFKNRI